MKFAKKVEKERLGTTESRSPSPGIRFEEEQVEKSMFNFDMLIQYLYNADDILMTF